MINNILNKYIDYANIDEYIYPKDIPGYITPERQKVEHEDQQINFVYKPIDYTILYDLDGGTFDDKKTYRSTFTVKDEYIPPNPIKDKHIFSGWVPEGIPTGTIGSVKFVAVWIPSPILIGGSELRKVIEKLCGNNISDIKAVQSSLSLPVSGNVVVENISSTSTPVYMWYAENTKILMIQSDYPIVCEDMCGVFKGFTSLRDISFFYNTVAGELNVKEMFEGCQLLSDTSPIEHWSGAVFNNIDNAFAGTMALETNTCPSWYKYTVSVNVVSVTGKAIDSYKVYITPSHRLYIKFYKGYTIPSDSILDNNKSVEITGNCEIEIKLEPIKFSIRYVYTDGLFKIEKSKYTIEDETFIPKPVLNNKPEFIGWTPAMIPSGSVGDILFVANYKSGE